MRHIAVALAIGTAIVPWTGATPLPTTGRADYYAFGVFEQVYAYRLAHGQVKPCPECVGYAALMRAGDIGRRIWIEHDGQRSLFLVVDCANERHFAMRMLAGSVVEVDYQTAQRWKMTGPITVTVGEWQDDQEVQHAYQR